MMSGMRKSRFTWGTIVFRKDFESYSALDNFVVILSCK